jgi:K+-transporting ATPase c subunit
MTIATANAPEPASSRLKRTFVLAVYALLLAVFLAPIVGNIYDHLFQQEMVIPDEQVAGQELLAQKFAGPRYFQPDQGVSDPPSSPDRYYISVAAARAQIGHIAAERKLDAAQVERLNTVIGKIAESPPSRVRGHDSINTLRLNLALDALK